MLEPGLTYQLLRNLTSPVVAVTSTRGGKKNGMILDAAVGPVGVPVLDECYAHFECRVANVMDTGSSTCFLGDVVEVGYGKAAALDPKGELMTATYFRANMPAEWRQEYEVKLKEAQAFAEQRSRDIKPWKPGKA